MSSERRADVAVIGAGVIGAAIAYHLAEAGAAVTVLEQGPRPAPALSATWASAGGLRRQGRHPAEQPLSRMAAVRWPELARELDADLESRFAGHLHLAETEAEAEALRRRITADRLGGIDTQGLEGAALRELAPAVTPAALAGALTAGDGQAHPGRTAAAFMAAAVRRGAGLRLGTRAGIAVERGRAVGVQLADGGLLAARTIVLAAGAQGIAMLEELGYVLPLRWRALQMLLSSVAPPLLGPTVTAAGRNLSLKQGPSGQMMVGGRWFVPPTGEARGEPLPERMAQQWAGAAAILPALADLDLAQSWAGAEAQSIDGLPLIGPVGPEGLGPAGLGPAGLGPEGLYAALGFSGHGFQVAPAVGALVARDLLGTPQPLLEPFRIGRFAAVTAAQCAAFRSEPLM